MSLEGTPYSPMFQYMDPNLKIEDTPSKSLAA